VHHRSTLSDLRDLDYVKAISDLTRQQLTYEAAQKSSVRVQELSLFDFTRAARPVRGRLARPGTLSSPLPPFAWFAVRRGPGSRVEASMP
jgi:hypothetical protein